jgi:hypothetical protein
VDIDVSGVESPSGKAKRSHLKLSTATEYAMTIGTRMFSCFAQTATALLRLGEVAAGTAGKKKTHQNPCGGDATGRHPRLRIGVLEVRILSAVPKIHTGDATGRHLRLRTIVLRVRLSPRVPNFIRV